MISTDTFLHSDTVDVLYMLIILFGTYFQEKKGKEMDLATFFQWKWTNKEKLSELKETLGINYH